MAHTIITLYPWFCPGGKVYFYGIVKASNIMIFSLLIQQLIRDIAIRK